MKVAGIVAEYNPFHNGHKHQIDALREMDFSHIIVAMSGNFVQRGDIAIADKWTRAKIALENGADLVVEIPTCYCLAPAEKYCFSAVEILDNLGVVDTLCFGSETGDLDKLNTLCTFLLDPKTDGQIGEFLVASKSFIEAREKVVKKELSEDFVKNLKNPNDVLGIEYLKALKLLNSNISALSLKRVGVGHNDSNAVDNFASASAVRKMIESGEDYSKFVPESSKKFLNESQLFPASLKDNERVVLAKLRELKECDFERLADVSEGLHNRLFDAVRNAKSLEELLCLAQTKRYTNARIRRLILNATLGIFSYKKQPYLRVLGFSQNGKELLGKIKENGKKEIVTSYADAKKIGENAKDFFEQEARFTDFFTMLTPKIAPAGVEFSESIVII